MSDDYGLTVYNNNGGLMFDSRRKMDSYVITEVGTGSTPDTHADFDDFVFVKVPPSMHEYVVFMSMPTIDQNGVSTGSFYGYKVDVDDGNAELLNLEYFIAKHSSKVSREGDYGLVIRNEDGSIQFDSRSVKTGNHFKITSAVEPKSYQCFRPQGPAADSLGDISDYWEIRTWTWGMGVFFGSMVQERVVQGLRFVGGGTANGNTGPIAYSWFSLNPNDAWDGADGQSATHTYKRKIDSLILSAELV